MFLSKSEKQLSEEYLKQGYIIRPVGDIKALEWVQSQFISLIDEILGAEANAKPEDILNKIHQRVPVAELNAFRLQVIRGFNAIGGCRELYFQIARHYIETMLGWRQV
jgi:hypothetical protein